MDYYILLAFGVTIISGVAALFAGAKAKTAERGGVWITTAAALIAVSLLSLGLGFQHALSPHLRAIPRAAPVSYLPAPERDSHEDGDDDDDEGNPSARASRPSVLLAPLRP
jgi:hypothetical protein